MDVSFIAELSCPYCRAGLDIVQRSPANGTTIDSGIVRCACYEYPIVNGILVLRQMSGLSDTVDPAVEYLRAGAVDRALSHLLQHGSMVPSAASASPSMRTLVPSSLAAARRLGTALAKRFSRRVTRQPAVTPDRSPLQNELAELRPGGFATYLYQRYANPSFLASIPFMSVLEEVASNGRPGRVLDLGCGVGHSTATLRALYPTMSYVAAEPDFVNLHILRRHFDPEALCVCVDAELPLPFGDDQFDAVFCLDAFHYIRSKWALARELDRVVDHSGVWLFPHLHNALVSNMSPGIPLPADDYVRMFQPLDVVLLDESAVLERFMADRVLDLGERPPPSSLASAAVFGLVAAHRPLSGTHDLGPRLRALFDDGRLGPNPIYRVEATAASVRLEMEWPDPDLERECRAVMKYLPSTVELDRALWDRIAVGALEPTDESDVQDLLDRFVLVPLAPGYRTQRDSGTP